MARLGSRSRVGLVPILILSVWAGLSYRQAQIWSSDLSLWRNAVQQAPQRAGDHYALAVAYQQHQRFMEARAEYAHVLALTVDRNWVFGVGFNLAEMLSQERHPYQALRLLEQLLDTYPEQEYPIRYFERAVLVNARMNCATVILNSGPRTVCVAS